MNEPTTHRPEGSAEAAGVSETTLRWAARLILVQATALAGVTALVGYAYLAARETTLRVALSVTGYWLMLAVFLAVAGVSLVRRRRWARGPAIVLELLQVPIGYGLIRSGTVEIGAPVLVVSLCAAGLLLAPSTRLALAPRGDAA